MAKSKAQPARAEIARRRQSAQAEAERRSRILLVGGVVAVILIAAGVIAFGWYQTKVRPLHKTVLRVGAAKYSLSYLEHRMRLLRQQDPTYGDQASTDSLLALPDVTMATIEREAKLLEAAGDLKLTVTEEEVAAEIRDRSDPPLAADVEAGVYADAFRRQVEESGLTQSQYIAMVRAYLLGIKAQDYFRFFAPASEPQVRGQYSYFDDQTKADQALERLKAGDPFDQVATELAFSGGSLQALSPLDWTPRTDTPSNPNDILDFLFSAQPGQYSDVITSGNFYLIAQLLERDDNRPLDEAGKRSVASRELNKWLEGLDTKLAVERNLSQDDAARALSYALK